MGEERERERKEMYVVSVGLVCKRNVFRRGKIFSGIDFSLVLSVLENDLEIYVSMFYKDALNKSTKRFFLRRKKKEKETISSSSSSSFLSSLMRRTERG